MTDWIFTLIERGGYLGIALLMALENIVPPIPSELIMGIGGMFVAQGKMTFWPLLVIGTIGTTLGNLFWFVIGRRLGIEALRPWVDRWERWLTVDWQHVETASRFFGAHGQWVIFASRFSPVMRTMLSLPAGLAHMKTAKFLFFTFAGAAIWNAILIEGGRLLHVYVRDAQVIFGWIVSATLIVFLVWYLWRVITWKRRHP